MWTLNILKSKLQNYADLTMELLTLCITTTYFQFEGDFY